MFNHDHHISPHLPQSGSLPSFHVKRQKKNTTKTSAGTCYKNDKFKQGSYNLHNSKDKSLIPGLLTPADPLTDPPRNSLQKQDKLMKMKHRHPSL